MAVKKRGPATPEQVDVFEINDLEQVKVLADPLRMRILEALVEDPRTTKQVAEELGEKPTRLYHHVEALERVGLIRLVKTRQNRGTVEKYYSAVARLFRANPGLFRVAAEQGETQPIVDMVNSVMENTTKELGALVEAGYDVTNTEESVISYIELHASEEELAAVRKKLTDLLGELAETCCEEAGNAKKGDPRYRLTLAYYPIVDGQSSRKKR